MANIDNLTTFYNFWSNDLIYRYLQIIKTSNDKIQIARARAYIDRELNTIILNRFREIEKNYFNVSIFDNE